MEELSVPIEMGVASDGEPSAFEHRVGRIVVTLLAAVAIPPVAWSIANLIPVARVAGLTEDHIFWLISDGAAIGAAALAAVLAWRNAAKGGTFALAIFLALLASWTIAGVAFGLIVVANILIGENVPTTVRPFALPLILAGLLLSVSNVRLAYREADPPGRRRMFWVMEGFLLMAVVLVLAAVVKLARALAGASDAGSAAWFAVPAAIAFFLLLVCLTIAMFFSGAVDPTLALERTAVYSVVGVALVFVFTAVESAVHEHLKEWLHLSDANSGIIIGGIVALSIEPLKHGITRLTDRVLARFGVAPKNSHTH